MSEILAAQTMINFLQYLGRQVAHPELNFRQVQNPSSSWQLNMHLEQMSKSGFWLAILLRPVGRIVEHSARKECSKSYTLHATGSRFEVVYLRTEEDVGAFRSPTFSCLTITIEYIHVVQILSPNLNSHDNAYVPLIVVAVFSERQEPARALPFLGGGVLHCQRGGKRACLLGDIPENSYLPQISASPASPSGHLSILNLCGTISFIFMLDLLVIASRSSTVRVATDIARPFNIPIHVRQILTPFMTLPLFGWQF
ncbi:hypothetical protein F5050DRAFT_1711791 [Lentinula boryana]|uniref:Uncharacterized protein n=1 Tax=Lentinula boryana TaxID=40481 RepID=A0ABQ8QEF7_9AGAR|nr:hypothetical protein F5050DRAFT_1711791 [Lentinula boryana]